MTLTHSWNLSPRQAVALQKRLKKRVVLKDRYSTIRFVAGCDVAVDSGKGRGYAGVIVYHWPGLIEVERKSASGTLRFPYIPGLLSFREGPLLLKAIRSLKHAPDLFIFDGQGIAHPRGFGIASHLGVLLNKPSIGCAKSRLCGSHREPALAAGSSSPLVSSEGKKIGTVLRTRNSVKPVFVSPGHRMSHRSAVLWVLRCCEGTRVPRPTREADHFVESMKKYQ